MPLKMCTQWCHAQCLCVDFELTQMQDQLLILKSGSRYASRLLCLKGDYALTIAKCPA